MNNEWKKSQATTKSSQAAKIGVLSVSFNNQFLPIRWLTTALTHTFSIRWIHKQKHKLQIPDKLNAPSAYFNIAAKHSPCWFQMEYLIVHIDRKLKLKSSQVVNHSTSTKGSTWTWTVVACCLPVFVFGWEAVTSQSSRMKAQLQAQGSEEKPGFKVSKSLNLQHYCTTVLA